MFLSHPGFTYMEEVQSLAELTINEPAEGGLLWLPRLVQYLCAPWGGPCSTREKGEGGSVSRTCSAEQALRQMGLGLLGCAQDKRDPYSPMVCLPVLPSRQGRVLLQPLGSKQGRGPGRILQLPQLCTGLCINGSTLPAPL